MNCKLALAAACICVPCWGQQAAPASGPASAPEPSLPSEPNVKHVVIDDKGSHIEELRVRGATQRIVVTPKVGTRVPYEIITGDGSRDLSPGADTSRGAAGQRVWNVLQF